MTEAQKEAGFSSGRRRDLEVPALIGAVCILHMTVTAGIAHVFPEQIQGDGRTREEEQ